VVADLPVDPVAVARTKASSASSAPGQAVVAK
jgi:hypothetical protein